VKKAGLSKTGVQTTAGEHGADLFVVFLAGVSTRFGPLTIEGASKRPIQSSRRQLAPFLERISYGLGQRYHYFDEISLFFETTRQYFRPRYVVLAIAELSRTITRFHQNNDNVVQAMRTFQTIPRNDQPRMQMKLLSKCLKWRFVPKWG
jgi:hypothetical protein